MKRKVHTTPRGSRCVGGADEFAARHEKGRTISFGRYSLASGMVLLMLGVLIPTTDVTEATLSPAPKLPELNLDELTGPIPPTVGSIPAQAKGRWRKTTISFYCRCSRCCGWWARWGRTASGKRPEAGVTVAASRSLPFGTQLYIEGIGWRCVEDRLNHHYDDRVDVFLDGYGAHQAAQELGLKHLWVWFPQR